MEWPSYLVNSVPMPAGKKEVAAVIPSPPFLLSPTKRALMPQTHGQFPQDFLSYQRLGQILPYRA